MATFRKMCVRVLVASGLAAALAGCADPEPEGQVVAVVNGEEITIPELNAEARARGLTIGDNRALRGDLLREMVQRKLLVQEAMRRRLDQSPGYLLASRRVNEMLLVDELATALGPEQLTDAELRTYVAANPLAFADRSLLTVRKIAADGAQPAAPPEVWDSATIPPDWTRKLLAAPPQTPVTLGQDGGEGMVVQLLSATAFPVPQEQRAALARQMIHQDRRQQVLQRALSDLQPTARVDYQADFAPAAQTPAQPGRP